MAPVFQMNKSYLRPNLLTFTQKVKVRQNWNPSHLPPIHDLSSVPVNNEKKSMGCVSGLYFLI